MTMEVEGPDGSVVEFPDGTPHEVIKGAMAKHFGSPTKAIAPQSPQEATDAMSTPDKFTRAGIKGLTSGASGIVNTLGKSLEGADPQKLAKLQQLIGAVEERMGVDKSQYAPASEITGDSSKPLIERLANVPRSVVEMAGPAALGFAGGGLPGAVAATTASTAGPTIDRKREALGLAPDQELPTKAKYEVGTKLAVDAALLAAGGKLTQGLLAPVEQAGVRGFTETGKRALMATAADAGFGMDAVAVDKGLIDKQMPTLSDLAVGAAQGALPGLAAHAPGVAGRMPGAARDAVVTQRFKALETIDPQSRGQVADVLKHYDGNFEATQKHLVDDLSQAKKGLDDVSRDKISKAQIEFSAGQRIDPAKIEALAQSSPEAARALQNLDTLSVMRSLDNGGVSGSAVGRLLNPFQRGSHGDVPTALGRFAEGASIGHAFWAHDPTTAAAVLGGQLGGTMALKGIDAFTGASNPAKVITNKYAGSANPTPTIAEAKAASFAKNLSERQSKAADAESELEKARADKQRIADEAKAQKEQIKADKEKSKQTNDIVKKFQNKANFSLDLLDKLEASDKAKAVSDEKAFWDRLRDQKDVMVNSQKLEDQRIISEQRALNKLLGEQNFLLGVKNKSETASSSDTGMALKVAKLRQRLEKQAEADAEMQGPSNPGYGSSSNLAGTSTGKEIALAKSLRRYNEKQDREKAAATKKQTVAAKAKADLRVMEAEAKAREAKADADENVYVFEHRGQKTRVDKGAVGNPTAYREKFAKLTDRRLNLLDEAKGLTESKEAHKLLDQLATDWTDSRNDPVQARNHLERIINKKSIPAAVRKHLISNWDRVEGTWATTKLELPDAGSD